MDQAAAPDQVGASSTEPAPLIIPRAHHDAMVAHCVREAPLECCGLLGGIGPLVSSFHPLRNSSQSETRYDADPRDLIAAVQSLRARGAEILAIYHSHPRWAAIPSRTDLAENHYGDVPRIIVSLLRAVPEVRVWRLDPESYAELPWLVEGESVRMPKLVLEIDGSRFETLEGFHAEVSRQLIPGASWGRNLDAFHDILRGEFGTPEGGFVIDWKNHEWSQTSLGYAETVRQLELRSLQCHRSNLPAVRADLEAARRGVGSTVFDWLVAIIREHGPGGAEAEDGIELRLR